MTVEEHRDAPRPSLVQRALALAAFVAVAALAADVVVVVLRNGRSVVLGTAGLLVAVAGAWRVLTGRGATRALGIAAGAAGLAAVVAAILATGAGEEPTILNLVVVAALAAGAVLSARAAMAGELRRVVARSMRRVPPPSHPVLLCNPRSGGGKVERFGLVELAASLGVETVVLAPGLDLEQLARDAVARGADCLGMAGGDGSQALVAAIAVEHALPFVCVPAGTRNHFALDLGLDRDDPRAGVQAFRDAVERRVDYATVNDRLFVNNVSLGVYATIVQDPGYRDAKSETSRKLLPELLGRAEHPFDLQFSAPGGAEIDGAFLVMVSNNPYVLGASLDVSQRRRMDSGLLGVFAVTAATGAQAAQVVSLALAHRSARSGHAFEFAADTFEVRSRSGKAHAGVDGEALRLETPLRFRSHPQRLRLLVPAGNPVAAARRQARDVHVRDLAALVAGRSPVDGGPRR